MKIKDIIKELQKYENQDEELVYDMFSECDIKEQAEEMEIILTAEQVSEVVKFLERYSDATVGMSWETIEYAITQIMEG